MMSESEASESARNTGNDRRGPESEPEVGLTTHARQLEAVRAVSEEIARELNLSTLLRLIIERALGLVDAAAGAISLWDEEHQLLIPQAWVGLGDWMGKLQVRLGEGAGGLAALRRQGVIQNDCRTSPEAHPVIVARTGATAALAEPLLYRDQLLGVIVANHLTPERCFTGEDQHTLRLFVPQAAVAIENARLFRQEQERIEQLDTVRAVTAEITHELDLPALLRLITQRSIELLRAGSGAVVLWDETAQTLAPAAWHGHGEWFGATRWRLGEGVPGTVAKRREGMVLNDYRNSPHAHPLFLLRTEITATLAEPLLYRDRLLGVVTIDGYGEGRRFSDQDRQLLSLLASQAAIAIENARLYAGAEAHARELETLREIEQAITSRLELSTVLEAVVVGAMRLLDNPYAQIILWDEANQALRFGAARGSEAERVKKQQFKLGRGINGMVAQTRQAMILDDYQASPYAEPVSPDVVATISVPILFGDRLLGVLHSHTTVAGRRFTPDDLRRLQMLAAQAALAIENARLHEATQKDLADRIRAEEDLKQSEEQARRLAQEDATMAEIGRIISSTLKIEEVYHTFANEVQKIIAFDRIVINSINVEKNVVRNLYIAGEGVQERNTSDVYPLAGSGNAEMVRTRASVLIQTEDFQPYAGRFPALVSTFQAGFRSILNVPLFAKSQVIGGLLLRSRQPNAYTEKDVRLAERIGSQIAGAVASAQLYLENARLYEAAQREIAERRQVEQALAVRTRHLETIRSIGEEITRELDLTPVLDLIVQRAVALVGATSGNIRLWHENQQVLVPVVRTGSERHAVTVPLRLGEGVAGSAAKQRRGLIVNDFRTSSYATPALLQKSTHTAVMATPLLYGERLVGTLAITREEGDPLFAEADLEVLNLFAPHASTAIENARLHETAVQGARQLATLTRVTQSLVASTRAETVGQEVMAAVRALMPEAAARLWDLQGDDPGTLEVVASVGLQDSRGGTVRFRRGEGLAGIAADSRRAVVSRDLFQDPRFVNKGWAAQEKLVSAILSPLVVGDEVRGILAVFTREPHDFSESEVGLFQTLATHAAIAFENARLYEAVRQHSTKLEARVRERTAELEKALQVRAEFLAKMSHELRTPLNFVLGFTDLLRQESAGPLAPKQRQFLDRVHTGGKQLLALVEDLLDLSLLDGAKKSLRLDQISLMPLVQEALDVFSVQVAQKHLRIDVAVAPELFIVADSRKLLQILTNLVGNAVKFTGDGGSVVVKARRVPAEAPGSAGTKDHETMGTAEGKGAATSGWIEIAVEDTGIGLQPADLERIFSGFEQVDGSPTRRYGGAGIGLALVRTLVTLHGGTVRAESGGTGQGARFVVRLPSLAPMSTKRILVVEDDARVREPLCVFLREAGYAVEEAPTGRSALDTIADRPPDLVVLDIGLPDMDGWEVLRYVREGDRTQTLPVVVLTGLGDEKAETAKALGANEYVAKPVSPTVITGIVRELLEKGTGRAR
jgi:GAF domain-containing protein/ActR/RegA family two-component response regulator